MKRIILFPLFAIAITLQSWAATKIGDIYYSLNSSEKTASVVRGGTYTGAITIPSTVTYNGTTYSVTRIGNSAFFHCTGLTSINISNSVTSIEDYAFSDCTGLTSINIPNSVTSIGGEAFSGCTGLTSINIPNSVTSIGYNAFSFCTGLTSINIPNSVTGIGSYAFHGCTGLTSITIPNSVTSIGSYAFYGCTGLTDVMLNSNDIVSKTTSSSNLPDIFGTQVTNYVIGDDVTSIGSYAFYNCSELTSITIGNSVTSISYNAFGRCTGLTNVMVNSNDIVSKTYTSSSNLSNIFGKQVTNYVIGDDVTSIGSYAFYNCSGLTSITIGNSVTSIGYAAFRECTGLTSVYITDLTAWCGIYFMYSDANPVSYAGHLFLNGVKITELDIPNSVTSIESCTFCGCVDLTSINIPNSVTSIGDGAFSGCTGLTKITIPNSVTNIGVSAFYGCSGLTSITISNSVTSIGSNAFKGCSGLQSITIPNSVASIGDGAFSGCTSLTSVTLNSDAIVSKNYTNSSNLSSIFGSQVTKYVLGDNVTGVGNYAFYGCKGLTSVTIPNSVTSIGDYAFSGCAGLASVTISESVTSIGSNAFKGCSGLQSITIPNSVASIGDGAFSGCTSLTSVTLNSDAIVSKNYTSSSNLSSIFGSQVTEYILGNNVTGIGGYAFYRCKGLTSVTIPGSVVGIGERAFANCASLTSITIPGSVTSIGGGAFSACSGLTSITIPESVTSIGDYAFSGCTNLTSITIPNSITSIGDYAFYDCANLTGATLPESLNYIGKEAFTGYNSVKLYVQKDGHVALLLWENGYNCYDAATSELILKPILSLINTTQSTATLSIENNSESYMFKVGDNVVANVDSITLTNLKPQTAGEVNLYASCKDEEKWYEMGRCQYTTANISPTATTKATGSSIMLTPSYIQGDATVTEQKMTFNGVTQDVEVGKEYFFNGLNPNKYYSVTYTISANGYNYTYSASVRCASLVMKTQHPKVINTGNVIVAAITNIDDTETNVGFEWRRTDWTDDFNSNTGNAYIYEGTMEGYIRNLNTEKLWKYRPFYESADGTRHYGDWVGIDPTDTSYFDPTVHTYSKINVQGNTASVKGYVMPGTDNVTEQGFKYWKASGNVRNYEGAGLKATTVPIEAQTITASGQVMTATLTGLDYETDYYCVAFVTTSEGMVFYGEQQAFRTGEGPTGISDVTISDESVERTIVGYYNLQGLRMAEPQYGVNIIRYSDGTTKKVFVK